MNPIPTSRRNFLKQTSSLALASGFAPSFLPTSVLGRSGTVSANSRVTVGCIGTGERGRAVLDGFLNQKDVQVVAFCDVKADQLAQARFQAKQHYHRDDCAIFADLREIVVRKDIDAFLIATPDHWHVLAALAAIRAGKDVYLEKPMGLSLSEDWTLQKEVHRCKRVFQFGTQQRSSRLFRFASELVRNGRIGKLKHINVWAPGSSPGGPNQVAPVPEGLNYDLWLGPAPYKPHTQDLCSSEADKKTWWFKSDYALGFVAGWGIHPLDIAAWGADLFSGPIEVEGRGTFHCYGACDTATVWDLGLKFANGVTMKYVGVPNGGNRGLATSDTWPQETEWRQKYRRISSHGTAFEGSDGWVHIDRDGINLQPENLIDANPDEFRTKLMRSPDHVRNFIDAISNRSATVSNIDEAVRSDTLCHLSEIAMRLNRKVVWDPQKQHFINDEEANLKLRARNMRGPWHL
jgi:predicted dehydrogenase